MITASVAQHKGLSIGTLTARQVMLNQLSAEIMKMKRMLLELTMVLDGEKEFTVTESSVGRRLSPTGMQQFPVNRLLSDSQHQLR